MTTITTRAAKGSALTHAEMDGNLTALRDTADAAATGVALTAHTGSTSNPHAVTKAQVGLGSADNTSDADKPVSTAQAAAIGAAVTAHEGAADPHPQYLTQTEGDARYAPAGISGATNLTTTLAPTGVTINSDTGTDATIPLADVTNAGAMPPAAVQQLAVLGTASEADVGDFAAADHTHALLMTTDERTKLGALPAAADLTTSLAGKMANTLPAIQTAFNAGTAPEKAAFQSSVSGVAIGVVSAHADALYRNVVNTSSRANTMWQSAIWLPTGVDAVQIVAPSYAADVSMQAGVKFSVQTTNGTNLANPHDAAAMVAATWGGAANPTFVAGSAAAPGLVVSDIIPVRNRGAGVNYAIIRQYYPAGATAADALYNTNPATTGNRVTKLAALGVNARYAFVGSDQTANSAASTSTTANAIPVGLRLFSRYKINSVANFGDSTRQGWNADGLVNAFERYAIAASLAGNPVAVVNAGITGQTSAEYLARLKSFVAAGNRADAITYQITTPNDGYSQAISDAQIARAMDAITTVRNAGMQIILDGPFPTTVAGGTPSADKLICANAALQFCMDMRARGVPAITYASLHGSTFGAWASTDLSGDGTHQTELATASVIAPAVSAALDSVLR